MAILLLKIFCSSQYEFFCSKFFAYLYFMLTRKEQNVLYDKYRKVMLSYLNKSYKVYDSEIIYNNTMYSVFTKINQFEGVRDSNQFDKWVWVILKRKALDQVRMYSSYYKNVILAGNNPCERGYIDQHESFIYSEKIKKLILYLPSQKHIDIFTDFIEGYSHKELSEKYNIPQGTSKWYVFDARRIIKEKIQLSTWMSKY